MTTVHYIDLMFYKAWAELRAEATRAYLGFLWWFLEPVIYLGVFYLIFSTGLRGGGPDFVPFLLTGLVAWKWFMTTVNNGSSVIAANAGLIQQVYVPKFIFPGVVILSNTFKFLIILLLLLALLLFVFDRRVTTAWLCLPLLVLVQLLFVAGCTGLAAALVPFAKDLRILLDNLLMIMFFGSGIFYDINRLPPDLRMIISFNPMALLLDQYRTVLLDGQWPGWSVLAGVTAFSAAMLALSLYLLRRFDRVYPKVISR